MDPELPTSEDVSSVGALDLLENAPPNFEWKRFAAAEVFIHERLNKFLELHPFAAELADRMREETSTLFFDWVDHLIIPQKDVNVDFLEFDLEFQIEYVEAFQGETVLWHPFAQFPRLILSTAPQLSVAIKVDSIEDFQVSHQLSLPIEGSIYSPYRVAKLTQNDATLLIVERRGYRGYLPQTLSDPATYMKAHEVWSMRQRKFDDESFGMRSTFHLARTLAQNIGQDMAAHLVLDCERTYWQKRNAAGCVQKLRQDQLGLGWANHDHHTFRSSRAHFPMLMQIFKALGFKMRERYYAGTQAGWGAQILEQPACGLVIFADLDLTPEDTSIDFSSVALPPIEKLGTIGLWCALHGESILQAGMHHLEAQFEFDGMHHYLETSGLKMMEPFSNFPYLKQAFSQGEMWPVNGQRLHVLLEQGKITPEQFTRYLEEGAIGSHLENLQRHEGYKGFNKDNVSNIIQATDPRLQHSVPLT